MQLIRLQSIGYSLTYTSNGSPLTNVTINDKSVACRTTLGPSFSSPHLGNDGLATGAKLTLKPKDALPYLNNAIGQCRQLNLRPISLLDTMPPQFGDGYPLNTILTVNTAANGGFVVAKNER